MAVKFKGTSEYTSKFKGRSARSRSASPHLRIRKAGLRSDQLGVIREPQFISKKRVPFHKPQVYRSFQWEWPEELPREQQTPKPNMTPAVAPAVEGWRNEERPQTPLAPRGPKSPGAVCVENEPVAPAPPPSAEPGGRVTAGEVGPALNKLNGKVFHALKRRAGLRSAGPAYGLHSSEYQRQFQPKTPVASSLILAAEQMTYSSSPAIPPFKVNPLVQESEYRRSFKGNPPPRPPRLRRDLERGEEAQFQPEQVSLEGAAKSKKKKKKKKKTKQQQLSRKPSLQNGDPRRRSQSQPQEMRSQSPQQPRPSHGGYRKVKSEYSAHFRSPQHYRLRDGVWVKCSTAAAEVRELREKAEGYRRRAWGTHFSRDHLNQISSEQNRLWEASTASRAGTERASSTSSGIIQALDLASNESVRGSLSGQRSLPETPSSSRRTSAGSSEEARPQNGPALPVRRKLVWGEAELGAGPEQTDRDEKDEQGEELNDGKRQEEEQEDEEEEDTEIRSDKATVSENQPASPVSGAPCSAHGGRLPTPKMKTISTIQRTHHDLTTPTTELRTEEPPIGGAILVSPPKPKESPLGRSFRRSEPPLGKPYSPYKALFRASPERISREVEVEEDSLLRSPPAAGLVTANPVPLRDETWPARPSPRPAWTSRRSSPVPPPPPSVPVPTNRIHGTLRDPEFQHNGNIGRSFGLGRREAAAFSSSDLSDDDERMSQISARSAASCSLASQVLERAQKRQKAFWSKSCSPAPC